MSKKKPVMYRVSKPKDGKPQRTIPTSKVVESGWQSVQMSADKMAPEAHPDDIENMRRSFYAGVYWLLATLIYTDTLEEGKKTATKQDRDRIGAIWWEVNDFFHELAGGKTEAPNAEAPPTVQ